MVTKVANNSIRFLSLGTRYDNIQHINVFIRQAWRRQGPQGVVLG
jgi:hypothetical protein